VEFAQALRERRASRRLSQLELALRAGTSQRHLSFIESGRSAPGREMVIRLGESLDLPLRERNELLLTAGYAPAYPETPLDHQALAPVMDALDHILAAHLPYPAIITDRRGDLVAANPAQHILFDGCAPELLVRPANAYRIALHPEGMAPRIANFAEWARHILEGIRAELRRNPDDRLAALHDELSRYVPPASIRPGHLGFAVPLQLRSPAGELDLMTTITSFATAVDVTVSELKLEAFLPANASTASVLYAAAPHGSSTRGWPSGSSGDGRRRGERLDAELGVDTARCRARRRCRAGSRCPPSLTTTRIAACSRRPAAAVPGGNVGTAGSDIMPG
jgi:transcriptional regulator with XRE-family HTH domain